MTAIPDTRERIIESARALFHERGYKAVGVADICKHARVVKGSFYHFFPAKDDLLSEVIKRNWNQLHGVLLMLERDERPARDCIASLFDFILAEAERSLLRSGRILGCRIGTIASEVGAQDVDAQRESRDAIDGWRRSVRRLVRRGQRDGSIDPGINATEAADSLLASVQGMSVIGRTLHRPAILKRIARAAMQLIPAAA